MQLLQIVAKLNILMIIKRFAKLQRQNFNVLFAFYVSF